MAEDRVLSGAPDGRLYRVVAGDAFSWSALLIEDQLGERFVLDTVTRAITPVTEAMSLQLIEGRAFRPWNGPQRWSSLSDISPGQRGDSTRQAEIVISPDNDTLDGASN